MAKVMNMYKSTLQGGLTLSFIGGLTFLMSLHATMANPACDSHIYCQGQLLHEIQMAEIFPDSKTFVDMHMKDKPDVILQAFSSLTSGHNYTKADLHDFVQRYFDGPGAEFEKWTPTDSVENPSFLQNVKDPELKRFGKELCSIWTHLGRKIKTDVRDNQQQYSLIYLPNPFIVPGGRFREIFYWDSYWVIKGLLTCEMYTTVRGMLENLLAFIDKYGMIPNGGRVYFTGRSQPPLMIPMVHLYVQATNDTEFISKHIKTLEKEYNFWATQRNVTVRIGQGKTHTLNRYATPTTDPRPESYKEDFKTAEGFSTEEAKKLYSNLASGAESGWDFSSRWFLHEDTSKSLTDTITTDILPVDLNSILCWNEQLLSNFFISLGNASKSRTYQSLSQKRADAIQEVMWNNNDGVWYDFNSRTGRQRRHFYPSDVFPLYVGCFKDSDVADFETDVENYLQVGCFKDSDVADFETDVQNYLQEEGIFSYKSGVPTSMINTTQQWDFPNGWPPLQEIVVTALDNGNTASSHDRAMELVRKWIYTNWSGWNRTKHMFEKYSVLEVGSRGGGGEYSVQEGFGWTNGVVLDFLSRYGAEFTLDDIIDELPAGATCDGATCGGLALCAPSFVIFLMFFICTVFPLF